MYSKLESREEIVMAVHQALVEVFTLKQADLPLSIDVNPTTSMPPNEYLRWLAEDASFEESESGEIKLVLGSQGLQDAILDTIVPKEPTEDETAEPEAVMEEEQLNEEGLAEAINFQQLHDSGGLEGPPPAIDSQPAEADRTETNETYDALPLVDSVDSSSTEDNGGPIVPANDSWRNVPLEDQAVKFAVGWNVYLCTLPTNECSGTQAGYATDRHTHPGPGHCERHQCKNIVITSRQEAQAEEAGGTPRLEGAGRTPQRANLQAKIRSNRQREGSRTVEGDKARVGKVRSATTQGSCWREPYRYPVGLEGL